MEINCADVEMICVDVEMNCVDVGMICLDVEMNCVDVKTICIGVKIRYVEVGYPCVIKHSARTCTLPPHNLQCLSLGMSRWSHY